MRHRPVALTLFAAALLAAPAGAAELCMVPSAANNYNVSVDCTVFTIFPNDHIGYSTSGPPCASAAMCTAGNEYGWTISSSSTDPFANTGAFTHTLYLWYTCNSNDGFAAAEFDFGGDLTVISLTMLNGFLNAGTATAPLLAVAGCPDAPFLAARIEVEGTVAVEPETWGRIKGLYREY